MIRIKIAQLQKAGFGFSRRIRIHKNVRRAKGSTEL